MTKIDELNREIAELKDKAEGLKIENKIDDALNLVDEIKDKKAEIEKLEKLENELKGDVKVMENKVLENKELLNKEEVAFANMIRKGIANDMKAGDNGAIIPTSISSRIIEKVKEISPIYARATKFNVGGDLVFAKENAIPTTAYFDEMGTGAGTDATFTTVKLGAFIARCLTKVSRSLINRTDFDIVNYVVNAVAKSIAEFLEKELILGTSEKIEGLSKVVPQTVTAIDGDALIDCQMAVKSALQGGCEWLMNPRDLAVVRKLKSADGAYLFQADATAEFGYRLLGKNVLLSDQVAEGTIFYGDLSCLYVKLAQDIEVNVLMERYADEFAVGRL